MIKTMCKYKQYVNKNHVQNLLDLLMCKPLCNFSANKLRKIVQYTQYGHYKMFIAQFCIYYSFVYNHDIGMTWFADHDALLQVTSALALRNVSCNQGPTGGQSPSDSNRIAVCVAGGRWPGPLAGGPRRPPGRVHGLGLENAGRVG